MKKKKHLTLLLLLTAPLVVAYTRSKVDEGISIFYYDGTFNCVHGEVEEACDEIGMPDCVQPIAGHIFTAQIFRDRQPNIDFPDRYYCIEPYMPFHR